MPTATVPASSRSMKPVAMMDTSTTGTCLSRHEYATFSTPYIPSSSKSVWLLAARNKLAAANPVARQSA